MEFAISSDVRSLAMLTFELIDHDTDPILSA